MNEGEREVSMQVYIQDRHVRRRSGNVTAQIEEEGVHIGRCSLVTTQTFFVHVLRAPMISLERSIAIGVYGDAEHRLVQRVYMCT